MYNKGNKERAKMIMLHSIS